MEFVENVPRSCHSYSQENLASGEILPKEYFQNTNIFTAGSVCRVSFLPLRLWSSTETHSATRFDHIWWWENKTLMRWHKDFFITLIRQISQVSCVCIVMMMMMSDMNSRCSSVSVVCWPCSQSGGSPRTPSCWAGAGESSLATLPAPPGHPPADILALTTSWGRGVARPGGGGHCQWRHTCQCPVTWVWSSGRPGREWWRQWRGRSLECWGSGACSNVRPGDGDLCQRLSHTWTLTNICGGGNMK